jgi:hypothetical protein
LESWLPIQYTESSLEAPQRANSLPCGGSSHSSSCCPFLFLLADDCGGKPASDNRSVLPPPGILDKILIKASYTNAGAEAERDLPTDEWKETPWRHNYTRVRRVCRRSADARGRINPELKKMSVTELVRSLKVASISAIGFDSAAASAFA